MSRTSDKLFSADTSNVRWHRADLLTMNVQIAANSSRFFTSRSAVHPSRKTVRSFDALDSNGVDVAPCRGSAAVLRDKSGR